jgi:TolB-like protein/tetratricopeptide (TPR) repeat protein
VEAAASGKAFHLGDWLVEPTLNRVSRGTVVAHVRPRLIELLTFLAQHAGQVVTKDQILEQVWQRRFVAESALTRSVADLRRLLGDDAEHPRFIETITKRGYRLVAAVSWAAAASVPAAGPSIVVLPFVDMAPAYDQEYLCDGLAEELTNGLAQLPGCRVVARTSAFAFKGRPLDVREIARQLGVSTVLEGSVQRDGNRLRITVQLIEAASGCHVWSNRFDCPAGDIFAVEDETVQGVVAALRVRMRQGVEARLIRARTANPAAHDLYLRGRHLSARRNPGALHQAAQYFERAIEADPAYAAAHAALAECHAVSAFAGLARPAELFPLARAEAERAMALAPDLAEACAVLGHERGMYEWRWQEAEALFRRALDLNPGYAMARVWYSHLLAASGRFEEAIAETERACECDPLSPTVQVTLGLALRQAGEFERAIDRYLKVLEIEPSFLLARFQLGRAYAGLGQFEAAVEQYSLAAPAVPAALGSMARILRRLGRQDRASEAVAELERLSRSRYVGPLAWAAAYADGPDRLAWLTRAFDEREGWVPLLNTDPDLADLHSNPTFLSLLARLGLPQVSVAQGSRALT